MLPTLEALVLRVRPKGLWLYSCGEAGYYGSWGRDTASRRSDIDLLVMGLEHYRLPLQPLVATPQLLDRHADAPFWRTLNTGNARPGCSGR